MKYLIYCFKTPTTTAYKAVSKFEGFVDVLYLGKMDKLIDKIKNNNYDFILGIGNFGRNIKRIRVESKFVNKYRKKETSLDGKSFYESTWKLYLFNNMYLTRGVTDGACNRSAYLVLKFVEENNLKSKLAFLHVARKYDLETTIKTIEKLLS